MQNQNIREYELMRDEMINLKDCVTTYMGYVLGGSGLAIFGLASLAATFSYVEAVVFASLILSIIISLILLILFYKFNSHNRFAGYCKLLNHERFSLSEELDGKELHFLAWEICIERLRHSDIRPEELNNMIQKAEINMNSAARGHLEWLVRQYVGTSPKIDESKLGKGIRHLFSALFARVRTNSWGFPPYVAAVFFVLVSGFWLAGFIASLTISLKDNGIETNVVIGSWALLLITTIVQIYLWIRFAEKLFTLLEGSATVDGFFWRFLPVRVAYLNEYSIRPSYVLIEKRLEEAHNEAAVVIKGAPQ